MFITRNIVEDYIVIFFTIVLGIVVDSTTKAILGYTFIILSNIIILIISKILCNVIVTIK